MTPASPDKNPSFPNISSFSPNVKIFEFYKALFSKIGLPLVTSETTLDDIIYSKHLAALGDALVNYSYSVARFILNPTLTSSVRVWDSSLATAIRQSPFNNHIKRRISQGELGDCVEALIAWSYMTGIITLEQIISVLANNLPAELLKNKKAEKDAATFAFISLLEFLAGLEIFKSLLNRKKNRGTKQ